MFYKPLIPEYDKSHREKSRGDMTPRPDDILASSSFLVTLLFLYTGYGTAPILDSLSFS